MSAPRRHAHARAGLDYIIRPAEHESVHTASVSSLCFALSGEYVFSAGRDATLRRWSRRASTPRACDLVVHSHHTDWITDVVPIDTNAVVTGSCDGTICAVQCSNGSLLQRACRHSDYITALASGSQGSHFASAGLGGEVFLWDSESFASFDSNVRGPHVTLRPSNDASVYALAMDNNETTVAAGTLEPAIKLWDTREAKGTMAKLTEHSDIVRALQFSGDGRFLVSTSSDQALKLYDLRMNSCVKTFLAHQSSIRAVACDAAFDWLFSGDKDGQIIATDLRAEQSMLLALESSSVHFLLHDSELKSLWAATQSSCISRWPVDVDFSRVSHIASETAEPAEDTAIITARDTLIVEEANEIGSQQLKPACEQAACKIPGGPILQRHKALPDMLHVLVEDTSGTRSLINILTCEAERTWNDSNERSFEQLFQYVSSAEAVPAWFGADTRLGSLRIQLEYPSVIQAEAYAQRLHVDVTRYKHGDEMRLNLGEVAIRSVLAPFVQKRLQKDAHAAGAHYADVPAADAEPTILPCVLALKEQPLVHVRHAGIERCSSTVVDVQVLSGTVEEEYELPEWAVALAFGRMKRPGEKKVYFQVQPASTTILPALEECKNLQASPIVPVRKVREHVAFWLRKAGENIHSLSDVQLQCRNIKLLDAMTLAYVREMIWCKRGEELCLQYKRCSS